MVQSLRPRLTAAQKTELWRRWRRGESLNAIGRALGRIAKVVRYEVARTGGIPPPARQRSRLALTLPEREAISRGLASGTSVRQISRQLRRAPSTVSREVRRHGGRRRYRAATADAAAWARGRRPKRCRLATYPALRDAVATKLAREWSPQQIAGWLRQAYPDDPTMHVSHETIYLSLFVQSRGVLKKALQAQLRQRRTMRRPRAAAPKTGGYIVGAVSIRERPATVEDRAVPGHWEGDLLVGSRNSYIATLVERRSRYVCLVVCRNSADRSRRLSIVEIEQSAETLPLSNVCFQTDRRRGSLKKLVLASLMIPLPMVVLHILVDEPSQVAFPQRDNSTETLVLDRPDKPLRIGIEIGTPCW